MQEILATGENNKTESESINGAMGEETIADKFCFTPNGLFDKLYGFPRIYRISLKCYVRFYRNGMR